MFKINKFEKVKEMITPIEVAERFLGLPVKKTGDKIWYKSPFRNERTASFCVSNEKGFHDFGDSTHYDMFSFIAKYFQKSNYEALQILIKEFSLPIENEYIKEKDYALLMEQKKKEKQKKETFQYFRIVLLKDILSQIKVYEDIIHKQEIKNVKQLNENEYLKYLYLEKSKLEYKLNLIENFNVDDFYDFINRKGE